MNILLLGLIVILMVFTLIAVLIFYFRKSQVLRRSEKSVSFSNELKESINSQSVIIDNKIFISYKRADKEKVLKIKEFIESNTNTDCWIDLDGIESDAQFANVIISAINKCEIFLFMYSQNHLNIDYDNDWTVREINFAQKKNKRIVFINIDNSLLTDWFELIFGTKQQVNAKSSKDMNKLISDINQWLNKKS